MTLVQKNEFVIDWIWCNIYNNIYIIYTYYIIFGLYIQIYIFNIFWVGDGLC